MNSCWWCRRKWKRNNHGGLMANHRMSAVLRRSHGGAVAEGVGFLFPPWGFRLHSRRWSWMPRTCKAMKETFHGESRANPLGTED